MFNKKVSTTDFSVPLASILLLFARIFIGAMFLIHGMKKWLYFGELSSNFPDPLHVGSAWSLILIIIAEVVCSIFFIFGFLYRIVLLPMIFAMGMAFFAIHDGSLEGGELSLVYMMFFIFMYFTGPGRYSVDAWIEERLTNDIEIKSM